VAIGPIRRRLSAHRCRRSVRETDDGCRQRSARVALWAPRAGRSRQAWLRWLVPAIHRHAPQQVDELGDQWVKRLRRRLGLLGVVDRRAFGHGRGSSATGRLHTGVSPDGVDGGASFAEPVPCHHRDQFRCHRGMKGRILPDCGPGALSTTDGGSCGGDASGVSTRPTGPTPSASCTAEPSTDCPQRRSISGRSCAAHRSTQSSAGSPVRNARRRPLVTARTRAPGGQGAARKGARARAAARGRGAPRSGRPPVSEATRSLVHAPGRPGDAARPTSELNRKPTEGDPLGDDTGAQPRARG
jgi:hypothetical protein